MVTVNGFAAVYSPACWFVFKFKEAPTFTTSAPWFESVLVKDGVPDALSVVVNVVAVIVSEPFESVTVVEGNVTLYADEAWPLILKDAVAVEPVLCDNEPPVLD